MTAHEVTSRPAMTGLVIRGVIGGIVAGLAFAFATMWFTSDANMGASMPLKMIATIVQGDEALPEGDAAPALGLVIHMILSMAYGVVFAFIARALSSDGVVALAALVYGVVLYVVNFLILAPLAFSVFEDANQPFELVVHVMFGAVLALAFLNYRGLTRAS